MRAVSGGTLQADPDSPPISTGKDITRATMSNSTNAKRVMVIIAHPDDAEFTAAGTLAKWAQEGKEMTYLVCTDGSKGSDDPTMTPQTLAAIRRVEQEAAARILGANGVVFLNYEDGALEPDLALRRDIAREIRRYKPDIAVCEDPTMYWSGQWYINHPDHRAAGEAALAAIFPTARDRLNFPELLAEGLEPHKVQEIYIAGANAPDVWVDITDTIDVKIAALKEHVSQIGDWPVDEFIRRMGREVAQGHDMEYAESFKYFHLDQFSSSSHESEL